MISRGRLYGQIARKYRNGCLLSRAYILFRRQMDDTAYYDINVYEIRIILV